MDRYAARRDKLRKDLRKTGVSNLLVTSFVNVTYLTGFTGDDSYLLVRDKGETLLSDPRYTTQLEEECPGLELAIRKSSVSLLDWTTEHVKSAKASRLGIEGASMTVSLRESLSEKLPTVELVTTTGLVEDLRIIKDKEEVIEIRRAIDQAQRAFGVLKASLRPDQTEKQIAAELESQIRLFGGKGCAFEPIIAAGPRAALPHARATNQKIGDFDFLLVDWGANSGLYLSDLTRVLVTGRIPPKLERIYRVVLTAQEQAIAAIRPGVACQEVDGVARGIIAKAGYGGNFGHGLGHGFGLQIHEAPRFAANQQRALEPGMVVTVEPGIYLPGFGGVRIEDDILVTKTGHEVLTSVPKQWEDAVVG